MMHESLIVGRTQNLGFQVGEAQRETLSHSQSNMTPDIFHKNIGMFQIIRGRAFMPRKTICINHDSIDGGRLDLGSLSLAGFDSEFLVMDGRIYIDLYKSHKFLRDERINVNFCPSCGESLRKIEDNIESCLHCPIDDSELVKMDIGDGTCLAIVMWCKPPNDEKPDQWYLSLEHKEIGGYECLDTELFEISFCPFCGRKL
jgi:hypothetical protein